MKEKEKENQITTRGFVSRLHLLSFSERETWTGIVNNYFIFIQLSASPKSSISRGMINFFLFFFCGGGGVGGWTKASRFNSIGVFTLGATFRNLALQQVCNWTLSCDSQLQPVATSYWWVACRTSWGSTNLQHLQLTKTATQPRPSPSAYPS